jgi:DnaJ domain
MDFKSPYFDKIRIKRGRTKKQDKSEHECAFEGCKKPATHRAPMGRNFEGQYLHFCFDHVREYNKSYNYFSGLDNDAISRFHKESITGHRPTWAMGVNKWAADAPAGDAAIKAASARVRARLYGSRVRPGTRSRKLRTLEKKAFDDLGLPHDATGEEIKLRYKSLVKRHHPDANGGDRSTEDRLRQIIHAYKYLKQAGFC